MASLWTLLVPQEAIAVWTRVQEVCKLEEPIQQSSTSNVRSESFDASAMVKITKRSAQICLSSMYH